MSIATSKLHVAIVGAGLGGLLLALSLQMHCKDINVNIYEGAAGLSEIGAGIGMWPRIWEVIRDLGLEDELLQITGANEKTALPGLQFRKGDQREAADVYRLSTPIYTFHRAHLQKLLVKHLHIADKIQFSKRLETYVQLASGNDPIVLKFKDGTSATCDLLIGSDGIKSAVRRTMYGGLADELDSRGQSEEATRYRAMRDPVWSGQVANRGLIPANKLSKEIRDYMETPQILFGKNKHLVIYPISRGEMINVVAFVNTPGGEGTKYDGSWVSETSAEDVTKKYAAWDPRVKGLLQMWVEALERPTCWAVHTTAHHLPTYVKGRVVLVGDAAHAMTPHQGSGAGQAIEDGFILASILAHPSVVLNNLAEALKIYDELRRPFAQEVQRVSQSTGQLYELNRMGWENVSEEESAGGGFPQERLTELGSELARSLEWLFEGSILQDRDKVLKTVESLQSDFRVVRIA